MGPASSSQRPSGLDLGTLAADLREAWGRVQRWPMLAALTPGIAVRVLRPDGSEAFWVVEAGGAHRGDSVATPFVAVELPEDDVLFRTLSLPVLGEAETRQAIALDVTASSPFAPDDLVWGFATQPRRTGLVDVVVALASRRQIARVLEQAAARLPAGASPEVWAWQPPWPPVVLPGFGESARLARARRGRLTALSLVLLAVGLAGAIALTPTAQLRLRAIDAVAAMDALVRRTEPVVKQRAQLTATLDAASALGEMLAARSQPLHVLELLTQALPDDTSLLGLNVDGHKVSMNGMTADAAALMQQLSARPEFKDVKAPSPATRPLGSNKDLFSIELTLVAPAPSAPNGSSTPAAPAADSAPAAALAPAAPAAAPPPAAAAPPGALLVPPPAPPPGGAPPPPPPPPPPQSGGASFGGGPTFGAPPPARP